VAGGKGEGAAAAATIIIIINCRALTTSSTMEQINGGDQRDGRKTACDAYKVGKSGDRRGCGKLEGRHFKCTSVCGRKEGNGGQKRKRKALLSGNISPFGFVRREPRRLHNLCQYFHKWHSTNTLREKL